MRNPFSRNIRAAWLVLSAATLALYSALPVRLEMLYDVNEYSTWVEVLLFASSLPSSLFLLISLDHLGLEPGLYSVSERLTLMAAFAFLGYFQWFYLAPLLFGRRQFTTLNLSPRALPDDAATPETPPLQPPRERVEDAGAPPVPHFDERGLTPVERVFRGGGDR